LTAQHCVAERHRNERSLQLLVGRQRSASTQGGCCQIRTSRPAPRNPRRCSAALETKAAVRDIALPPFLVDGLDRLLRTHPFDTVFCTTAGGWLWRTTFIARAWRPACDGRDACGWAPIIPEMTLAR
jgi:hypothetical protein